MADHGTARSFELVPVHDLEYMYRYAVGISLEDVSSLLRDRFCPAPWLCLTGGAVGCGVAGTVSLKPAMNASSALAPPLLIERSAVPRGARGPASAQNSSLGARMSQLGPE